MASLAASAVGFLLLHLRRPSALPTRVCTPEDGVIFLLESLRDGASAVVQPYNAYIHLLPRLISAVSSLLPLAWTPMVFTLATAAVSVACCAVVLSRRFSDAVGPYGWRLLLFCLLLLIPRMTEVHLSLNSVLWWCGVALFLFTRPTIPGPAGAGEPSWARSRCSC